MSFLIGEIKIGDLVEIVKNFADDMFGPLLPNEYFNRIGVVLDREDSALGNFYNTNLIIFVCGKKESIHLSNIKVI
jgi:hypothetical protein